MNKIVRFIFCIVLFITASAGCSKQAVGNSDIDEMFSELPQTFSLENPTDKEKFEKMTSITFHSDQTAVLATPLISSYMLPKCTYQVSDNELKVCAAIKNEWEEGFFGVKNGDVIAVFTIIDSKTLKFKSASVPIFADENAEYIKKQEESQ